MDQSTPEKHEDDETDLMNCTDGLLKSNRLLRDVSLPLNFRTIYLRGKEDWEGAMTKLYGVENCAAIPTYAGRALAAVR